MYVARFHTVHRFHSHASCSLHVPHVYEFYYLQCWLGKNGKTTRGCENKKKQQLSIENKCRNAQHEAQCMHFVCSLFGSFSVDTVRRTYDTHTAYNAMAHIVTPCAYDVCKLLLSTSVKCIFFCSTSSIYAKWYKCVWIVASI